MPGKAHVWLSDLVQGRCHGGPSVTKARVGNFLAKAAIDLGWVRARFCLARLAYNCGDGST